MSGTTTGPEASAAGPAAGVGTAPPAGTAPSAGAAPPAGAQPGASAPGGPGGPVDAPRQVRQRHVRRGWVGVGVLMIVLAALGAATLFRAIGPSEQYLVLTEDVPAGTQLTSDHLNLVRLNTGPGLSALPADRAEEVVGAYTAVPLMEGTLLAEEQLTPEQVPGPGEQLVSVSLDPSRVPGDTLPSGAPVMLVATADRSEEAGPRTFDATVHDVRSAQGRSNDLYVSLVVPASDGATVAELAASEQLTVVRVPGGGS